MSSSTRYIGYVMRRRFWLVPLAVVLLVALVAAVWPRGVVVTLRNGGTTPMRDVRVVVTGGSYAVGELRQQESRSVRVKSTGESHMVLRYADAGGIEKSVEVDCYFEPGYSGRITVDVADGAVVHVDNRVRSSRW